MILDTNLRLELKKDAAASASEPEFHVDYVDWSREGKESSPAVSRGALSASADVVILAAPGDNNPRREPIRFTVYNKDTASHSFTLKTDDGTTERIITRQTLLTLETLSWEKGSGWQVFGP